MERIEVLQNEYGQAGYNIGFKTGYLHRRPSPITKGFMERTSNNLKDIFKTNEKQNIKLEGMSRDVIYIKKSIQEIKGIADLKADKWVEKVAIFIGITVAGLIITKIINLI